jgi:carbamoyl-phosphate synthase/aspartate carbamoyltransferase/dihydroorotase
VSCEVAPHHLFLQKADEARLGPFGIMRPVLGHPSDVAALWEHLEETVDCIATDHAPHTIAEKKSDQVPPGVPGLETSLLLMLSAVLQGRLTSERLIELMVRNPRRIFGLPEQPDTSVEVELEPQFINNEKLFSKCGWTPFAGMEVAGQVKKVILRGKTVFADGKVLARPGSGQLLPGASA